MVSTDTKQRSSCKCIRPSDQFKSPKTCRSCAAKAKIKTGRQPKKRSTGRAKEGPPGTKWCSSRNWCPKHSFKPDRKTCDEHLHQAARLNRQRNSTGDGATAEWDPDDLIACASDATGQSETSSNTSVVAETSRIGQPHVIPRPHIIGGGL
jgi:hypothetical protein